VLIGGIEAGGTKFVCAVSDESARILDRSVFPTSSPEETLRQVTEFFDQYELDAIGIGSFGPIDVTPDSPTYGYITNTPKAGWGNTDIVGPLKARYHVPVAWTTDVNAAAAGELEAGAAQNNNSCLYITVGTGIGGGAIVNGKTLEGYGHPEMGHIIVERHPKDFFEGSCPYHGGCLEGMASGPAIEKRYGKTGRELADQPEVWKIEAYYLAQGLVDYSLILSPEKIILGGGVMKQQQLFPLIRDQYKRMIADYIPHPPLDDYIVPPGLGDDAGIIGSLLLAKRELNK